jgi:hypothetical protein
MASKDNERHDHTPDRERAIREAALDETLAESFPASDPLSKNPNPDNHDAAPPEGRGARMTISAVTHNEAESRFDFSQDGQTAVLSYHRKPAPSSSFTPAFLRDWNAGGLRQRSQRQA